ncbi:MAG: tail fiber domain-containing protein [Candidatus Falkowbacteria bacterium]
MFKTKKTCGPSSADGGKKLKPSTKHSFSLVFLALATLSFVVNFIVRAAPPTSPYNPGETLDPNCPPGDPNCTVTPPAISGVNSNISGLIGLNTQAALQLNPYGTSIASTSEIRFLELAANGNNYVGFKAPANIATNAIWQLPSSDGTSNQVLMTDGGGALSFTTVTSSQWVTDGTDIYYSLGNVGIGGSNPSAKLEVRADNLSNVQDNASGLFLVNKTDADPEFMGQWSPVLKWEGQGFNSNEVSKPLSVMAFVEAEYGNTNPFGRLVFRTGQGATTTDRLVIMSNYGLTNGNVGIGTHEASSLFTVGATTSQQFLVNTLGVITDGTWQGDIIGSAYGGLGTSTTNTVIFRNPTTSTIISIEIPSLDRGVGAAGQFLRIGNNNNATGGAGSLILTTRTGTNEYLWVDNAGLARIIASTPPTNANDTSGTVIGAQTSLRDFKQDITEYTDYDQALAQIINVPLHYFRYKNEVSGYGASSPLAKSHIGFIADEVSSDFMWGNAIDQVSINGLLMGSVKSINRSADMSSLRIDLLGNRLNSTLSEISQKTKQLVLTEDQTMLIGDLVMFDTVNTSKVIKSFASTSEAMGVVVSDPSLAIASSTFTGVVTSTYQLSIVTNGQASVKIATNSEPINPGDLIMASDMSGMAMKATGTGWVLGIALETVNNTANIGTTTIFIDPHFNFGSIDTIGNLEGVNIPTSAPEHLFGRFALAVKNSLYKLGILIKDGVMSVKEIITEKFTTKQLCLEDVCVDKQQLQQMLDNAGISPLSSVQVDSTSSTDLVVTVVDDVVATSTNTATVKQNIPTTAVVSTTEIIVQ